MAAIRSLGVHQPVALQYLIDEHILPGEPNKDEYAWETYNHTSLKEADSEELLFTDNCVVYSSGDVVHKVFKFDIEEQRVQQAVLTWFDVDEHLLSHPDKSSRLPVDSDEDNASLRLSVAGKPALATNLSVRQRPGYGALAPEASKTIKARQPSTRSVRNKARAIVVFLKFQAHVYFLHGPSHIINLPFEIDRAFPAPQGLILQRKIAQPHDFNSTPLLPSVPQNSFLSSGTSASYQLHEWRHRPSKRSRERTSGHARASFALEDLLHSTTDPAIDDLPRHYSLTDPLADMGLVVAPANRPPPHQSSSRQLEPLLGEEEILYVSPQQELVEDSTVTCKPLVFIITANSAKKMYRVYTATYVEDASLAGAALGRSESRSGSVSRRRSSFVPGTGATTPGLRSRDQVRESLGAHVSAKPAQGPSKSQTAEETFASQIDPDFRSFGQPQKESRRVSSLLSRVDLSTAHDRSTFHEFASGHTQAASVSGRRAPSFGAGASRNSNRDRRSLARANTPGSTFSRPSFGMSDDETIDDAESTSRLSLSGEDQIDDFLEIPKSVLHQTSFDSLRQEVVLNQVAEFPLDKPGSFSSWTKSEQMHRPRIFTLVAPATIRSVYHDTRRICIHIVQSQIHDHVEVALKLHPVTTSQGHMSFVPTLEKIHRFDNHLDATMIRDGPTARVLCLQGTTGRDPTLSVTNCSAPTASPATFDIPPLNAYNQLESWGSPSQRHESTGRRRVLESPKGISGLSHSGPSGTFSLVDRNAQHHRLQLQLLPASEYMRTIIEVCRLCLPNGTGDVLLSAWWAICRGDYCDGSNSEWNALQIALLSLAVGHVPPPTGSKRRAGHRSDSNRPSSRISSIDSEAFRGMIDRLRAVRGDDFFGASGWSWTQRDNPKNTFTGNERSNTPSDSLSTNLARARRFVSSNRGSPLLSALYDGNDDGKKYIPRLLVALHVLREEQKLNVLCTERLHGSTWDLVPVLAQFGYWLGWEGWTYSPGSYFNIECDQEIEFDTVQIQDAPSLNSPPVETPPSVFDWIEEASQTELFHPLVTLTTVFSGLKMNKSSTAPKALTTLVSRLTPRTVSISQYFEKFHSSDWPPAERVELLLRCGIDRIMLRTLPYSVVILLKESIRRCQASPPTTWNQELMELVGRDDLAVLVDIDKDLLRQTSASAPQPHLVRDVHSACHSAEQPEPTNFTSELERHRIAQLIFHEDRRYWEAEKLLNTLRPSMAECIPDPSSSEAEILEAQKSIVQLVMVRTFALAAGQSMFHFDSRKPLITEKFHIHGYNMSCVMKPMNITVSAERVQFTEEKYGWAWFHAGVSAGLSVSKHAEGIDTSWIVFNKPNELSNRHAGLLLGLGLNGHLRSIAKWLSFKYLTPKHTMTSIGLLLGLSVSFLGSMDTLVTRLLSVHITCMLPAGAAELNLSPLTQTTGLMGIGMLYHGTQHRRMSEIMLSEIEHTELQDPAEPPESLRDESYRLAAGVALGFINLGKGKDLRGLHDMRVVERLLAVAVGARPVDLVHVLDQATAGAVIAIALIFMKTNDKAVARKIDVPDTLVQFDYIRPDILLLRTLARHLIMWDEIKPTSEWIRKNLPSEFSNPLLLAQIRTLNSEHLPFYNILAGLLWTIGLRYAGSGSIRVRDFLVGYLDHLINIASLPASRYDGKLARNTVRNCQDLVALCSAAVMAGTGDIVVFRRLRRLHGRIDAEVTYGSHMAAHMALGILFLGGGVYTFGTSNLAIASLILSFYPLYPTDVTDNRSHLQAFRHFWVLAAEARCLVARDLDSKRVITMPITVQLKGKPDKATGTSQVPQSQEKIQLHSPVLLPPLATISQITTTGPDHWPVTLDFKHNPVHLAAFRATQTVLVRRRPASAAHSSVFSATLVALNEEQSTRHAIHMWQWIFTLPAFRDIQQVAWTSILPLPTAGNTSGEVSAALHGGYVSDVSSDDIDARLTLLTAARRGIRADQLRDLKALFRWADELTRKADGKLAWLGKSVVDQLRGLIEERGRRIANGV